MILINERYEGYPFLAEIFKTDAMLLTNECYDRGRVPLFGRNISDRRYDTSQRVPRQGQSTSFG